MWSRPNTFETLVHIILEQQVSLASALSALNKLKEQIQELTPARLLLLTDEEMRACYCSRQKTSYIRYLAEALLSGQIKLDELEHLPNDEVRAKLITLKGIGHWTIDVYLMFVLQRADIFPVGDLAAVNAMKRVKNLPKTTTKEELIAIAAEWQPYRTVATMMLWHFYLSAPTR
jgi:DNA-3-methyladenine glycosylase II